MTAITRGLGYRTSNPKSTGAGLGRHVNRSPFQYEKCICRYTDSHYETKRIVWDHFTFMMGIRFLYTHWGRVTHTYVGTHIITGSDNGLSPGRRQAITWTNVGILLFGPLGTYFSKILFELHFHSRKLIWKSLLQNGRHFVSASICLKLCADSNGTLGKQQQIGSEPFTLSGALLLCRGATILWQFAESLGGWKWNGSIR